MTVHDRYAAKATRLMPALYGGFIRVPAYTMAERRKRAGLADWLKARRGVGR
jgi:hypothetical protein